VASGRERINSQRFGHMVQIIQIYEEKKGWSRLYRIQKKYLHIIIIKTIRIYTTSVYKCVMMADYVKFVY